MKRIVTLSILMFIIALTAPVSATEIRWNTFMNIRNGTFNSTSIRSLPNGDYFVSYFNPSVQYLQTSLVSSGDPLHQGVIHLPGAGRSSNEVGVIGSTPFIVYNDEEDYQIAYTYYLSGVWNSTIFELPATGHASVLKHAIDGNDIYIVFNRRIGGSAIWTLELATFYSGNWHNEIIEEFTSNYFHGQFDIEIDSQGIPHIAYWDETDETLKFSKRIGANNYQTTIANDDLFECKWLNLEFIQTDIPMIGHLESGMKAENSLMVAHSLGANWSVETIFTTDNIYCLDMAVNNQGSYTTSDFYFVLCDRDGYHCVRREFPSWQSSEITELSGQPSATTIRADWNEFSGEVGAVIQVIDENGLYILKGGPYTPTPTPTPTFTPTQPPSPTYNPPTSTPTPLQSPSIPTPTPTQCPELGATIDMPQTMFNAGDMFYCNVDLCNPSTHYYDDLAVLLILDVYGSFFFAPSFSDLDFFTTRLKQGTRTIEAIAPFPWPSGAGSATDIWFYAGMTDIDVTRLIGTFDAVMFGWN